MNITRIFIAQVRSMASPLRQRCRRRRGRRFHRCMRWSSSQVQTSPKLICIDLRWLVSLLCDFHVDCDPTTYFHRITNRKKTAQRKKRRLRSVLICCEQKVSQWGGPIDANEHNGSAIVTTIKNSISWREKKCDVTLFNKARRSGKG